MEKTARKTAIVVGAGAGGIATAARLAKAGFSVTVLEKNSFTGGRCSLMTQGGHRFDQGPSLLLLPKLFHEVFHDLETTLEAEGVELLQCPTNYKVWFADGENFELSTDLARMKTQIERWEGKYGFSRYLAWLREAHDHYELSVSHVLSRNFTSLWELMTPRFVVTGLRLHPLHTIWGRAANYFWSERLRRVFTFATMYMGMSPFDAPATYSLLQYTELAEGIWYPRGGFHAVLAALQRVGERLGVEYWLNAPVDEILTHADGKTARGVRLQWGEVLEADVVVVNADLVYAYNNLFPQASPTVHNYGKSLLQKDGSCSSISFYWSLDRKIPQLQTHNIFLADGYRESFDAIFDRKTLPEEPSFYVNVPSRIDPSAAPEGRDTVVVLVPVGHLKESRMVEEGADKEQQQGLSREKNEWPALISRARRAILSTITARTGCNDIGQCIQHEMINDPFSWEDKFNLDKGSILGLSHSFFNVLAFRPSTRAKGFAGVYFVGASTHPGTGVPIVLAGSKITAEQILEDMKVVVPWRDRGRMIRDYGVPQTAMTGCLDVLHEPYYYRAMASLVLVAWVALVLAYGRPLL
ncbi:phytoene dehydrogenase [Xylariaceae sp. FL0255]|nr:phytoene dehydrogenase [Xylariaceae sp. FL0255]